MLPSGPSDSAFTQRRAKPRVVMGGWVNGWVGGDFLPLLIFFINDFSTRGFAPRCVKAESLGPEGSMIGYKTKKKMGPKI